MYLIPVSQILVDIAKWGQKPLLEIQSALPFWDLRTWLYSLFLLLLFLFLFFKSISSFTISFCSLYKRSGTGARCLINTDILSESVCMFCVLLFALSSYFLFFLTAFVFLYLFYSFSLNHIFFFISYPPNCAVSSIRALSPLPPLLFFVFHHPLPPFLLVSFPPPSLSHLESFDLPVHLVSLRCPSCVSSSSFLSILLLSVLLVFSLSLALLSRCLPPSP